MKKILVGLGAVVVFALSACGSGSTTPPAEPVSSDAKHGSVGGTTEVQTVTMPDGRTVDCVVWSGYKAGGISCNWAGASRG